ncbi:electron transfer flavoprotein subunit beta/FixA family protein [Vibrio mangrovi]|uniref:Electron transfer flavoprotein subunit beta n=1 Tax=Vibrio mangrovi TaxID=474394 RepID=A0A1Y6IT02_9VIBR|nr:electron transfer flavoprotein subunit beta/FixA family protein [Vibrio mangrovi]MDW6004476.1 electron transfer flavoprotein subunit beta/FixA family protein [Vibrio mangrovi]SMS00764.1 Electron transfer flavoprotein subunit beta [Vibrio mangrovi]
MKALVAIKRVADPALAVRVQSDQSCVDLSDAKMVLNPYCEIALEEAIQHKEAGVISEIVAVSVGVLACQEQLRTALALGADRAIHVEAEDHLDPLIIAKLLAKVVEKEQPALIFAGKQSVDNDNNQTGQMLAGLLGISQGTFASDIEIDSESVLVTREIDHGQQVVRLTLPTVLTADLPLNKPRHASLPNVMKARRKPIEAISAESLGVVMQRRTRLIHVESLNGQRAGIKVDSVEELVNKLKNEARVI